MGAVIMKHSDKAKFLRKKNKDDYEERLFQAGKKHEAEAQFKMKLQELNNDADAKRRAFNKKEREIAAK